MRFRNNTPRLNILDIDLNPVGTISRFSSLTIKEDFFGIGTWEAEVGLEEKITGYLSPLLSQEGHVPALFVDFNTEEGIAGIIDRTALSFDSRSKSIRMSGKLLDGLCGWRLIVPDDDPDNHGWDISQGKAGAIMAHYVDAHMVNPAYPDRKISNLEIAYSSYDTGEDSVAKGRFEPVGNVIEALGRDTRTGWHIRLQREIADPLTQAFQYKMIFKALDPVDRTKEKSIR